MHQPSGGGFKNVDGKIALFQYLRVLGLDLLEVQAGLRLLGAAQVRVQPILLRWLEGWKNIVERCSEIAYFKSGTSSTEVEVLIRLRIRAQKVPPFGHPRLRPLATSSL